MWSPNSLWFEIAIVSAVFAIGNITMGHFEEQAPKWRRLAKYFLSLLLICSLSVLAGRTVALLCLGFFFLPVLYIHAYYLPRKKGINGWTGEPREKYYAFRGWKNRK